MEIRDIDVGDFENLRQIAANVIDNLLAGGVPPYIDRDELIGECVSKLPSLLAEYGSRNGASLATFLKRAWRNDAKLHRQGAARARAICGAPFIANGRSGIR